MQFLQVILGIVVYKDISLSLLPRLNISQSHHDDQIHDLIIYAYSIKQVFFLVIVATEIVARIFRRDNKCDVIILF